MNYTACIIRKQKAELLKHNLLTVVLVQFCSWCWYEYCFDNFGCMSRGASSPQNTDQTFRKPYLQKSKPVKKHPRLLSLAQISLKLYYRLQFGLKPRRKIISMSEIIRCAIYKSSSLGQ